MKGKLRLLWPAGLLLFVWMAFAFPYWGKGLIPFPSKYLVTFFSPWSATHGMPVKNNAMPDVITQIYPWKRVTTDAYSRGEIPLWNPYSFSGTSHVGNYQSAVFSPVNILFLFLPEIHAWSIMILLQPILAGIFMFLFLRSLRITDYGSLMGAVAFMFCGFMVVWMAYGTLGYAVLYLPLALFGINIFLDTRNARTGALIPAAIGLSFVSGHFQMSLYVLLFSVAYLAYRSAEDRSWSKILTALALIVIGLALAAPQILPAYQSYTQAVRSSLFSKGEVIPWAYFVTLFSPDFYGNPVTRNDWFGHYAEWAGFIGVIPLILSLFAITMRTTDRNVRFFIGAAVITVLLAFQSPLVDILFAAHIPVLSTSAASRIILLLSFSLAVLSAYGTDMLYAVWEMRTWRKILPWFGIVLFLLCAVWITVIGIKPLPSDKLQIAIRNSLLPTGLCISALIGVCLGFLAPKRMRRLVLVGFIVLAGVDVYRFAAKWMPFEPSGYMYPQVPVISKLQELVSRDQARVMGNIGNEVGSAFKIPLLDGYDAVYQYRYGKFVSAIRTGIPGKVDRSVVMFEKNGEHSVQMLSLLGVRYYLHKMSDGRFPWAFAYWDHPEYVLIWQDRDFQIYENTAVLPRTFLVSSYEKITDDKGILDRLFSRDFLPSDTVILETDPPIQPASGSGSARIRSYRPDSIVIDVSADVPKLLFLSDVYDSGWQATVDNVRTPILRADFDFRAVSVPKGEHTVRFSYAPKSILYGYYLAGFATLGMVFLLWRRKR